MIAARAYEESCLKSTPNFENSLIYGGHQELVETNAFEGLLTRTTELKDSLKDCYSSKKNFIKDIEN